MPGNPLSDPKWATDLADAVERFVSGVRGKTTRPLFLVYRAVMFGVVALIGGTVALIVLIIALTRALEAIFDIFVSHSDAIWMSYVFLGLVLMIVGLITMKRRFPSEELMEAGL